VPDLVRRHPGPVLLAAAMFWAAAGLVIKAAPVAGPPLALWRCLLGAGLYQAVLAARGQPPSRADLRASALGGLGFGLSVVFLFVAYKSTTLVSANVIACLQPLALGVVAHRADHRLGPTLWAATAAASAGTVIVVLGSSTHTGTWSLRGDLFALAGTAANVVYVIGTKRARATLGAVRYQASMLWVAAAVIAPIAVGVDRDRLVPGGRGWQAIAALVAFGGTGHMLFSAAQRHVSVAASSSILLAEVLAVSIGAALLFDQPIGAVQALGMVVVGASIAVWVVSGTRGPRTSRSTATGRCARSTPPGPTGSRRS
jgi:drug/metabolite transporter (DMT)-like permease